MVQRQHSGSRDLGSNTGWSFVLCSGWARHFSLTVPLSTQEYKWVPANCQGNLTECWWVTCDGLASHPGGVAILLVVHALGFGKFKCEPISPKPFIYIQIYFKLKTCRFFLLIKCVARNATLVNIHLPPPIFQVAQGRL